MWGIQKIFFARFARESRFVPPLLKPWRRPCVCEPIFLRIATEVYQWLGENLDVNLVVAAGARTPEQ